MQEKNILLRIFTLLGKENNRPGLLYWHVSVAPGGQMFVLITGLRGKAVDSLAAKAIGLNPIRRIPKCAIFI
jgi:hypothetical protein